MTSKENGENTQNGRHQQRVCLHYNQQLVITACLRLVYLTMWWGRQQQQTRWRSRSWASCSPPPHLCGSSTNSSGRWPDIAGWDRAPQLPHSPGISETTEGETGRKRHDASESQAENIRSRFSYKTILTCNIGSSMTNDSQPQPRLISTKNKNDAYLCLMWFQLDLKRHTTISRMHTIIEEALRFFK